MVWSRDKVCVFGRQTGHGAEVWLHRRVEICVWAVDAVQGKSTDRWSSHRMRQEVLVDSTSSPKQDGFEATVGIRRLPEWKKQQTRDRQTKS